MSITPEKTQSKPRELVPQGNHVARLYQIALIGTVETPFRENPDDPESPLKKQTKVRLSFELPNETREFDYDGETKTLPMAVHREVTLSLYRGAQVAALRLIAEALVGEGLTDEEAEVFDVETLLGKACMVQVVHAEYKDNKYAKAESFGSIPNGMDVPEAVNPQKILNVREMTKEEIDELPEWLGDKMKASEEYQVRFNAKRAEKVASPEDPEAVPF